MVQLLNRKRIVHTLGVAGLGLGLLVGAPLVMAQESQAPGIDRQLFEHEEGTLDLNEEELKHLLIQLLRERAQEKDVVIARLPDGERGGDEALRIEVYNEFTQALADELGIADADEVDAAIRSAMMAGVDANDGLSKDGKEEMKALITDAAAPIGPTIRGWGG